MQIDNTQKYITPREVTAGASAIIVSLCAAIFFMKLNIVITFYMSVVTVAWFAAV
jgi:hypothetical protein